MDVGAGALEWLPTMNDNAPWSTDCRVKGIGIQTPIQRDAVGISTKALLLKLPLNRQLVGGLFHSNLLIYLGLADP